MTRKGDSSCTSRFHRQTWRWARFCLSVGWSSARRWLWLQVKSSCLCWGIPNLLFENPQWRETSSVRIWRDGISFLDGGHHGCPKHLNWKTLFNKAYLIMPVWHFYFMLNQTINSSDFFCNQKQISNSEGIFKKMNSCLIVMSKLFWNWTKKPAHRTLVSSATDEKALSVEKKDRLVRRVET